ncbi:DUF899 family protein [Luteolibacter soli]|uniref:DUF899 family protein n=1 Tax=Luteolibacter soli TaxID=3135280 RepID=A0ABU9AR27_9BACT
MNPEIAELERQVMELSQRLANLRKEAVLSAEIPDYTLETLTGPVTLSSLFAGKDILFAIHNMGQGCRYCTLWADGLNGFVPHLEDKFSLVLLSKDSPEIQQRMAHSRGWRFRMASHGGGPYAKEQTVTPGDDNMPGIACYQKIDGKIFRKGSAEFGPGDAFCSLWSILSLAGLSEDDWTPQYSYWKRPDPKAMEDGGDNLCCG